MSGRVTHKEIYERQTVQDAMIRENRDNIAAIREQCTENSTMIKAIADDVSAIDERLKPWDTMARDLQGIARFGRICRKLAIWFTAVAVLGKSVLELGKHLKWWT